jgi:hypothetical protein
MKHGMNISYYRLLLRLQWPRGLSMKCLLSLEHSDRAFESHSSNRCFLLLFCVCVVLRVGSGLASG